MVPGEEDSIQDAYIRRAKDQHLTTYHADTHVHIQLRIMESLQVMVESQDKDLLQTLGSQLMQLSTFCTCAASALVGLIWRRARRAAGHDPRHNPQLQDDDICWLFARTAIARFPKPRTLIKQCECACHYNLKSNRRLFLHAARMLGQLL